MDYTNYTPGAGPGEGGGPLNYRKKFILAAAAVFIVVLLAAAGVLCSVVVKDQKYNSAIKAGNAYYNAGDYQNAIVQYQLAISLDKRKDSGYLNMASAYIGMGDYTAARSILDAGLQHASYSAQDDRYARLDDLVNRPYENASVQTLTLAQITELSKDVTVENSVFDMVAAYTYTEYYRDGQYAASAMTNSVSGGRVSIDYPGLGFQTVYYNLSDEKVLDNSGNTPVAGAKPCEVSFHNLKSIFSCKEEQFAVSYDRLTQIFGKNIEFHLDNANNRYYISADYKGCKLQIQTDESGNIVSEYAWNVFEPKSRAGLEEEESDGQVKGYVQDAKTGRGMRATIKIRERGSRAGNIIAEFESESDGSYTFAGAQGLYTAEFGAGGYVAEFMDLEIIRGQVKTGKNIALSPVGAEGEIRIVLSWGANPTDLDSHAEGRSSTGTGFHISFENKIANNIGELDLDDTNGYGPETITITDTGASFKYSVVDFTNSGRISSSGATVKVYRGSSLEATYNVPAGSGNTWSVFKIENGVITPINSIN